MPMTRRNWQRPAEIGKRKSGICVLIRAPDNEYRNNEVEFCLINCFVMASLAAKANYCVVVYRHASVAHVRDAPVHPHCSRDRETQVSLCFTTFFPRFLSDLFLFARHQLLLWTPGAGEMILSNPALSRFAGCDHPRRACFRPPSPPPQYIVNV